jgi:hypothetical protein
MSSLRFTASDFPIFPVLVSSNFPLKQVSTVQYFPIGSRKDTRKETGGDKRMISAFHSFIWRESNAALFWNSGSDQLGLKKS